MQELCASVAKDITRCANTCDAYQKLVLVVRHRLPFLIMN